MILLAGLIMMLKFVDYLRVVVCQGSMCEKSVDSILIVAREKLMLYPVSLVGQRVGC